MTNAQSYLEELNLSVYRSTRDVVTNSMTDKEGGIFNATVTASDSDALSVVDLEGGTRKISMRTTHDVFEDET